MAIRDILHYPDPRLRNKALPVTEFNAELKVLIDDMFETMYHDQGIGLAATQINVPQRVIVMDIDKESNGKQYFINPEIIAHEGKEKMKEGCLSVPEIWEYVERAEKIRLKAQDINGKTIELDADGLFAVCIQHEIDHLDGKLFIDYLSPLKLSLVKDKMEKIKKKLLKKRLHTL